MSNKVFPLIISFLGICASFLPWVVYPKSDMKLYGYMGDGIITAFLFFTIPLFLFLNIWLKKDTVFKIYLASVGLINFLFGIVKLYELRVEQSTFTSDNFAIVSVTSGFHEGAGLYLLIFAGLMCLTLGLYLLFGSSKVEKNTEKEVKTSFQPKFAFSVFSISLLIFLGISFYFNPSVVSFSKSEIPDNLTQIINSDIKTMAGALENNDYNTYKKYVHQSVADGLGGDKNLKMFFEGTFKTFLEDKVKIKNIEVGSIIDTKADQSSVQSLFTQKVTFDQNGNESVAEQTTLGIKEKNSKQWKYITIDEGKSVKDLRKVFPNLNPNLKGLQ